jgi:hypothetical protein
MMAGRTVHQIIEEVWSFPLRLQSSGMCCAWQMVTNVLEKPAASIFSVEEGEGSRFLQNIDNCLLDYITSQPSRLHIKYSLP